MDGQFHPAQNMQFAPGDLPWMDTKHQISLGGNDAQCECLLHFNGTDASTTLTDSSSNANNGSAVGNGQIDTAQSKFGGASFLSDGTGDSMTCNDIAAYAIGSSDFCVDFWVRPNSYATTVQPTFVVKGYFFDSTFEWQIGYLSDLSRLQVITCATGSSGNLTFNNFNSITLSTGTWYHILLSRDGSVLRLFINGLMTSNSPQSNSVAIFDGGQPLQICGDAFGGSSFDGWMDEFRLSIGTPRARSNFVPPTSAYA